MRLCHEAMDEAGRIPFQEISPAHQTRLCLSGERFLHLCEDSQHVFQWGTKTMAFQTICLKYSHESTMEILGKPWLFWKLPPTINQPM